jgi:hypothetical protein
VLADYCWNLVRGTPTGEYKRQKNTKWVFNEFFCTLDTIYKDSVHYLAVYVAIKTTHYSFSTFRRKFELLMAEAPVRSQGAPSLICAGQSGNAIGSPPRNLCSLLSICITIHHSWDGQWANYIIGKDDSIHIEI